jgi:hypothetical protein
MSSYFSYTAIIGVWKVRGIYISISICRGTVVVIGLGEAGKIIQGHKFVGSVICAIGYCFPLHIVNGEILAENLHIKIR